MLSKINPVFIRNKINENEYPKNIHFQALTWYAEDFETQEDTSDGESKVEYNIYINGVTEEGHSITVRITDFKPYFYVEIPDSFRDNEINKFYGYVEKRLSKESYGLDSYSVTKKKKIYPYLGPKKFKFAKLNFKTERAFKKCKNIFVYQDNYKIKIPGIGEQNYKYFETNIENVNRFCHLNDLETTGWICVKKYKENDEYSTSQINITVKSDNLERIKDKNSISPITIFSWDIECLPEDTEEFPNPDLPNDVICLIGVVIHKYGTEHKQKFIFSSKLCSHIEGVVVVEGTSEKELLTNFCEFVKIVDPDFIIGYNTWGFDDKYLWKRMKLHDIDFSSFSRISQIFPSLKKKELSSNAYGNNEYNYIDFTGRETFDVIEAVRREHKLQSYSLNAVAEHFLKENKVDLPYRELFEILANGDPDKIAKAAEYCIGDADLPLKIVLKLNMIPNYVEMAKTTHVPISWLLFRGQQCKVFSLIVKFAMKKGFIIPVYEQRGQTYAFKGAKVLSAYTGLYYDPIAGLDFASLYPSIMIAYNMCYSTFIEDKDTMNYVKENGIPYETIEWEEDENESDGDSNSDSEEEEIVISSKPNVPKEKSIKKYSFSFVQYKDKDGNILEKGQQGILGEILLELWQGRKDTKKLMKNEKDNFKYAVLNGKQLAQKVTMNSMYGFTGADKGILPLKPIAASVTATGRKMIQETSSMAKERYGAITIYGDSIPEYEIITIKKNGKIEDMTIGKFADLVEQDWEEYRGFKVNNVNINNKLYKNVENLGYLTYTHKGFQLVKKVIKHDTSKKLYRIKARDSAGKIHEVVVTEGHSLIKSDGNLAEAKTLQIGDKLLEY